MNPRPQAPHGCVSETAVDLVEIIDGSVAQLWETIESLERLQPRNLERFRVSIFGSGLSGVSTHRFFDFGWVLMNRLPPPWPSRY